MTYEHALRTLTEADGNIMVLTAENRAAIRSLDHSLGDRFIDYGICEQTMVAAAAGLALRGRVPVVHALATFLTMRAFEFIRTDVGIPHLPVKLIGAVPGFLSEANGPTHQAIEDIAIMRSIPNMRVCCPADLDELCACLPHIVRSPHPWYVRFNSHPASIPHTAPFREGEAELLLNGSEVTLLSYGTLASQTFAAATVLTQRGHSVRMLNMRTLKPIDEMAICTAARETPLLITIEDHLLTGGLSSIVAEVLTRHTEHTRVVSFGLDERWFVPALFEDVLCAEGFTADMLADRIEHALAPTL